MNSSKKKNASPFIVAYGHNNLEIEYFFIVVEQSNMISVCVCINIYIVELNYI